MTAVFKAVGRLLQGAGVSEYYGDYPSFGRAKLNLKRAYLKQAVGS